MVRHRARDTRRSTEFTGKIKELGPLGESEGITPDELQARLDNGLAAVSSRKVRMIYGNTAKAIRKEGIFTQEYISAVIEEKLSKAVVGALSAGSEEGATTEPAKKAPKEKPAVEAKIKAKEKSAQKAKPAAARKAPSPKKGAVKKGPAPKKAAAKKTVAKKKTAAKKKK